MGGDAAMSRLAWRCRRGMRELDVLMMRYLNRRYASASTDEQAAFHRLLDLPDPELAALCFGKLRPADVPTARVLEVIQTPD